MSDDSTRWRPNVAAIIVDTAGNLLLARKNAESRHMHFPQGGVRADETYEQAIVREVYEEVGLPREAYEVLGRLSGLRYAYRDKNKKKEEWEGQQQTWFLLGCKKEAPVLNLSGSSEFEVASWVHYSKVSPDMFVSFKREVVAKALKYFMPEPGETFLDHLQMLDMARVYRYRPDRPFPQTDDRRFFAGGKEEMVDTMREVSMRINRVQRRMDHLTRVYGTPPLRMLALICGSPGSNRRGCLRRVAACCDPLLTRAFRPEWQPEEYDMVALQQYPAENEIRLMCRRMQDRHFTQEQIDTHEMKLSASGVRLLHFHLHPKEGQFQEPDTILPCYLVPCEKKWYRDYVITSIMADTLEKMLAEAEKILAMRSQ